VSRALDVIGERWTVLIVRDLLAGPRRYTDLPGVCTDVLATAEGAADLAELRPTDALRAHWFAIPLMSRLAEMTSPSEGVVNIRLDEGALHILIGAAGPAYGHGLAERPDAQLGFDGDACAVATRGEATLPELIKKGQIRVDSRLAQALRDQ
jgi:hypothetical protein